MVPFILLFAVPSLSAHPSPTTSGAWNDCDSADTDSESDA